MEQNTLSLLFARILDVLLLHLFRFWWRWIILEDSSALGRNRRFSSSEKPMSASEKRRVMNLDLNSTADLQRSRTMSLSDLVFDELLSPMKTTSSGSCRTVVTSSTLTPTPTQFFFPTSVTAEQEAYASGFARALEEIYHSERQLVGQPKMVTLMDNSPTAASSHLATLNNVSRFSSFPSPPSYSLATTGICSNVMWPGSKACDSVQNLPNAQPEKSYLSYLPTANCFNSVGVTHPANVPSSSIFTQFPVQTSSLKVDDNDQNLNWHVAESFCAASKAVESCASLSAAADSTVSGPLPKVDFEEQDQRRLERKRAKNRVAAARCQERKLERITRLQEKVQELRDNNARLGRTVVELRSHVSNLRKQILMHTERGCRMMIPAMT